MTTVVSPSRARRFGAWYVAEHKLRGVRAWFWSWLVTTIGTPFLYLFAFGIGLATLLTRNEAFADLIDSALNVVDDGFDKSDEEGFKVAQIGHDGCLMSFYENLSVRGASWSLRLAPGGGGLSGTSPPRRVARTPDGTSLPHDRHPELLLTSVSLTPNFIDAHLPR